MTANLLTAPLVEPVTVAETKAYLKIEQDIEDELLRAFITTARVHLEHLTGKHLITQTWRLFIPGPLSDRFTIPLQPLSAIVDAAILSDEGDLVSLSAEGLRIHQDRDPASIANLASLALRPDQRLRLDVETGYGPAAEDVPEPLRLAMKIIIAEWFERRLIADPSQLPTLWAALKPLIGPFQTVRI